VESCFRERICENIVAEITARTITTVDEAVHYLAWTFLARRVVRNPSYYGAQSASTEDTENFLFDTASNAVEALEREGCVEVREDSALVSTPLGLASTYFYLTYKTPQQMQIGIRESYTILSQLSEQRQEQQQQQRGDSDAKVSANNRWVVNPFHIDVKVDEAMVAWLLYVTASTHEFDEIPVRHNEEIMNEELSKKVIWGPDADSAILGSRKRYVNPEVYADPHTKSFLLLQAYLGRDPLPISDYVNDTTSVLDNTPRLLAAMQFIATHEPSANSLDLISHFVRIKQLLKARSLVGSHPLYQLPGFLRELMTKPRDAKSVANEWKSLPSMFALRRKSKEDATRVLKETMKRNGSLSFLDRAVSKLFAIPKVFVSAVDVSKRNEKDNGSTKGTVTVSFDIERESDGSDKSGSRDEISLILLLGTYKRRIYQSESSLRITRYGKWSSKKELTFDWNAVQADAGEVGELLRIRILLDTVRGLDQELTVRV
jgi:Sec63 Brl domain